MWRLHPLTPSTIRVGRASRAVRSSCTPSVAPSSWLTRPSLLAPSSWSPPSSSSSSFLSSSSTSPPLKFSTWSREGRQQGLNNAYEVPVGFPASVSASASAAAAVAATAASFKETARPGAESAAIAGVGGWVKRLWSRQRGRSGRSADEEEEEREQEHVGGGVSTYASSTGGRTGTAAAGSAAGGGGGADEAAAAASSFGRGAGNKFSGGGGGGSSASGSGNNSNSNKTGTLLQRAKRLLKRLDDKFTTMFLAGTDMGGVGGVGTGAPHGDALHTWRAVVVAGSSNFFIFVAKLAASYLSGSGVMFAEALHSLADFANQLLLFVGLRQSLRKPSALHPYGYAQSRSVWGLISATGVFFLGCGMSVYHGVGQLFLVDHVVEIDWLTGGVLGFSMFFELSSFAYACYTIRQLGLSEFQNASIRNYIKRGSDNIAVAVFMEDFAAFSALVVAAASVGLTYATGNTTYDAVGTLLVGGWMGAIAVRLMNRNISALLGQSMDPLTRARAVDLVRSNTSVVSVHDVKTTQFGQDDGRFKAEIQFEGMQVARQALYGTLVHAHAFPQQQHAATFSTAASAAAAAAAVAGSSNNNNNNNQNMTTSVVPSSSSLLLAAAAAAGAAPASAPGGTGIGAGVGPVSAAAAGAAAAGAGFAGGMESGGSLAGQSVLAALQHANVPHDRAEKLVL